MNDQHYRAFGSLFFLLHQDRLLWLLNAPIIGRWFRRVLRISGDSSSVGHRPIFRILPNAIFWWDGPNQKAEFRTHAKFSKRLYYAFAPLWWAMHAWDWAVADRWIPELSFGFATLGPIWPDADPETNTVDGSVSRRLSLGSGVAWGTIIAGAGTNFDDSYAIPHASGYASDNVSNQWIEIYRAIFLFDTSALTSGASISSAVMSLYGAGTGGGLDAANINIYKSTPASNTALVAADFSQLGPTAQCDTAISFASWAAAYNDFTFNATGRGNVSKTSISKFGSRDAAHDVANSSPTWASDGFSVIDCYSADQAGTANDPKLVVTYTVSVADTAWLKETNQPIFEKRKAVGY